MTPTKRKKGELKPFTDACKKRNIPIEGDKKCDSVAGEAYLNVKREGGGHHRRKEKYLIEACSGKRGKITGTGYLEKDGVRCPQFAGRWQ